MLTKVPGGAGVHGSLPSVALNVPGAQATGTTVVVVLVVLVVVVVPPGAGVQAAARTTSTANGTADVNKRLMNCAPRQAAHRSAAAAPYDGTAPGATVVIGVGEHDPHTTQVLSDHCRHRCLGLVAHSGRRLAGDFDRPPQRQPGQLVSVEGRSTPLDD